MEQFVIKGGKPLYGTVRVQGAKNSALPILAATLLVGGIHEIQDVPRLSDIDVMNRILKALGVKFRWESNRIKLETSSLRTTHIPEALMQQMRSSIFLMGPLLARFGEVTVFRPGGCAIGARPIDLHLKGLKSLGAEIREEEGHIHCQASKLVGADIYLDLPSVGATENIMMAAVLAEGETVIKNAAREPEIVDLQRFLNRMGADVHGAGTDTVKIRGVRRLHPVSYEIIPDRIVAGTLATAAVVTGGEVLLTHVVPDHMRSTLHLLEQTGAEIKIEGDALWVRGTLRPKAVGEVMTQPYPGFPTDMQPQIMVLLSLTEGTSYISERIFDGRLRHVGELIRMGANLRQGHNRVEIRGVPTLTGARVEATDLRAGAALVTAGLAARGTTCVSGLHHIDRGYERLDQTFLRLGGQIQRYPGKVASL
ncbi:MAG: UDP-N-acetylglucosamine 1-carboxyvinyltransferase [Firmicutes bacterium]|uniref:UDP-N-acetylglucosamine 1-carboxyvinyltransferase n=1 Tax=Melghirimyces thermohalophilus TaxID=1236220 RepID=A0A1G6HSA3_9BACL|nr:UDP-N-acetylglucosamine 1-carboxyvinyltransferase [Melghirimyces thermohalophilus]MDA8354420.1 UDP-N-acetylglucosamine 1-carboxyvinyltransferase [Bacillota bacterium]SDB96755.1 UDP-N-acetylglucosamine 1-carboxyvinyltransferase [Melghirimyces thermohalophilus]